MITAVRFLRLLAVVVWVGGIVFFAFVLAPVSFRTLPTVHLAGSVVGAALKVLDRIGLGCGIVLLATIALLFRSALTAQKKLFRLQLLLVLAMTLLTAYLHWSILPAMDLDREQAGGDITAAAPDNPARMQFDRLHQRSEHTEGAVLLLGVAVVFLIARSDTEGHSV